jgi:hypothetical protein
MMVIYTCSSSTLEAGKQVTNETGGCKEELVKHANNL